MKSFTFSEILVYNPTLTSMKKKPIESDTQEAKIMAYFPSQAPIQQKCNTVGMAEGVYSFCCALFSENEKQTIPKCQVSFLDNCCLVLKEVQENIWLYLKLSYNQPQQSYSKPDQENEDQFTYMKSSVSEKLALKILDHFYLSFWTFYGNISAFLFLKDLAGLQKILQYFVKTYEQINRNEQTKKLDASSYLINSIRAIPLDVNSNLKFAYFKNVLESYDNNASDMIVFSNGLLVYSSLPKDITGLFAQYFFGTGDPYRFDLNIFPRKIRLIEELFMINSLEKYGTVFNSIKFGFGDGGETMNDGRSTFTVNSKIKKSEDLLGIEEADQLAFPSIYLKKNDEEHKMYMSCFFEKKMLILTFFRNISSINQIQFQNKFYHDNTDKFAIKITEIYNNLLSQNDIYKFMYSNLSTYYGKCTIEKWNNFVPEIKYVWEKIEENKQSIVATRYSNHWVYGVHRFNRALILMIPSEVQLQKLEEFTERMTKQYFFKAFM